MIIKEGRKVYEHMLGQVKKGHSARREELKAIDQQFLRKKKKSAKKLDQKREKETHGTVFQMLKNAAHPYKMCIIIQ